MSLASKMVKIDSKIIILVGQSKSLAHSVIGYQASQTEGDSGAAWDEKKGLMGSIEKKYF